MNNLETKVNYWDVGKLKTSHRLEKIKQCSGKTSNLEKEIPEATTLIHINQYNTDKQNLVKKIEDVDKKKYQIRVV